MKPSGRARNFTTLLYEGAMSIAPQQGNFYRNFFRIDRLSIRSPLSHTAPKTA